MPALGKGNPGQKYIFSTGYLGPSFVLKTKVNEQGQSHYFLFVDSH
ncbi:hypothetical protein ABIB44_001635 [Hymenobacter sp. UYCo722]